MLEAFPNAEATAEEVSVRVPHFNMSFALVAFAIFVVALMGLEGVSRGL